MTITSSRRSLQNRNAHWHQRAFFLLMILLIMIPSSTGKAGTFNQEVTPSEKAQILLDGLTPEERVGQLFLVTFDGMNVGENTQIYDLITNHHIGGVILQAANDNFTSGDNALTDILEMNRQLQLDRWQAAQQEQINPLTGESYRPAFIPLLIGTSQEGDGPPFDEILNGLTQLPNEMAIGATWNPDLALQVGTVLGQELSALGINLLLGPSLDVLEQPRLEDANDLGTRTFGGDPYWVGQMGQAFITGVHQGSAGGIAVVAKHFPGNGGSDRSPEEEVATVRKSREQLENFDLVPFFAVTGEAPSQNATVDALLTSHIRYQGFQENIRATTRPISFDPEAIKLLLSLPQLSTWRDNGGVMISDSLGSQAVRRFYELTGQAFDANRVALNAFLAGNDLLYLGNITSGSDPDSYTSTVHILEFFTQKYREDPSFAQRVDEKVLRILTLKYRLYPSFSLNLPPLTGIDNLGESSQVTFDVAQQAATLISPSQAELDDAAPDPPNQSDRIVFLTDVRTAKQCTRCPVEQVMSVDAMQQAVLRLYGPRAGNQIFPNNLTSYSFSDLDQMLDGDRNSTQLETDLRRAHWIVFAMLNVTSDIPSSQALRRFLSERPDLVQQKRLVVFAFNSPYYLDATNISKIMAYYGLYSKSPRFIDVAARLLFREMRPTGALPVSVPGIGYDLITATSPDPNQVIPLQLDIPGNEVQKTATVTAEPTPAPEFHVGNNISVRTGVIIDHNGHRVPDGTPVQFIVSVGSEVIGLPQTVNTVDGVARTTIQVTSPGALEIRAESEPARQSQTLHFDIPTENGVPFTETPTVTPTETPTVTPSPTTPPPVIASTEPPPPERPTLVDWLMALFVAAAIAFSVYRLAALIGQVRWGVRSGFLAWIGGLLAYSYLALKMPGSEALLQTSGAWGVILVTLLGCLSGILITWGWRAVQTGTELTN